MNLEELRAALATADAEATRLLGLARRESRRLSPDEHVAYDSAIAQQRAIADEIDDRETQALRDSLAVAPRSNGHPMARATVTRDDSPYRPDGTRSFLLDLGAVARGDSAAAERIAREKRSVIDDLAKRGESRAISTTDGVGGEFVPPLWAVNKFVGKARPRRVFADWIGAQPLPPTTDSINTPKVLTGTAVGPQGSPGGTQNSPIQQTDLTSTSIAAPVVTIAGGQVVSLQLVHQSPARMDEIILTDLAADYSQKLNTQLWTGTGTNGTMLGALSLSGTNAISWTGTTLTGATSFRNAVLRGISAVYTQRYEAPDALFVSPRRWLWMVDQNDAEGRSLIVPVESGPNNSAGILGALNAQGAVGRFAGLDVYIDATMPLTLGTGSDEDRAVVCRKDDLELFEGELQLQSFEQTYADQLSLFVRAYNFAAFQPARYPSSISVISGSGMAVTLGA